MSVRALLLPFVAVVCAGVLAPDTAAAQRQGGRYTVEYEGDLMGGVTGTGARYSARGGSLVIELPPVVRSYPTIRFTRSGASPERPEQFAVGGAGEDFAVTFEHPDLPVGYVADAGSIRVTEVEDGRIRGEFVIVASRAGSPGQRTLTFRGQFEALSGR